jgi:hypothetical protein
MAGGELYARKDILGHKAIVIIQRYAHLSPAYKCAMADRMEQMWARPAKPANRLTNQNNGSGSKRTRRPHGMTKSAVAVQRGIRNL